MKKCLYRFCSGTQKSQGICRLPVGISLPAVSPIWPFIPPFVGQNKSLTSPSSNYGFTIIELMSVLVVAAILIGIAVPSIESFVQNSRVITESNNLVADLSFARSEAIKRAANISICKLPANTNAPPCSTAGNNWASGRVIFVDTNGNGQVDGLEEVLRNREESATGITLNAGANLANFVVYNRLGMTTLTVAGTVTGLLVVCDKRENPALGRSVTVETTGRAAIAKNPTTCSPP